MAKSDIGFHLSNLAIIGAGLGLFYFILNSSIMEAGEWIYVENFTLIQVVFNCGMIICAGLVCLELFIPHSFKGHNTSQTKSFRQPQLINKRTRTLGKILIGIVVGMILFWLFVDLTPIFSWLDTTFSETWSLWILILGLILIIGIVIIRQLILRKHRILESYLAQQRKSFPTPQQLFMDVSQGLPIFAIQVMEESTNSQYPITIEEPELDTPEGLEPLDHYTWRSIIIASALILVGLLVNYLTVMYPAGNQ